MQLGRDYDKKLSKDISVSRKRDEPWTKWSELAIRAKLIHAGSFSKISTSRQDSQV